MSEPYVKERDVRDAVLQAVALTTTVLHDPSDLDAAVHDVLAGMGSALNVSRAYIFRNRRVDGSLVADLIHEWAAEGVTPQISEPNLQGVPYDAGFQRWRSELSERRAVHGRIETFPPEEQEFLAAQDIRSLAAVPITVAGEWWGFMGLDDCRLGQMWSDPVLQVLSVAADTLGAALHRRALEARLAEHRQQLERAERLEALGRLAGGVAHDFNNILTAITVQIGLIEAAVQDDAELLSDIRELNDYVERGTQLTRQLLAFGGRPSVAQTPLDLREAILRSEPMLRRLVEPGSHLDMVVPGTPLMVRVDPSQFGQVLLNLVLNAAQAAAEGGHVRVTAEPSPDAQWALLTVTDDGRGIPPDVRDHLFEPFFTTKGERGTGLGLSIVFGIVTRSGGSVRCDSEPGEGATFTVELPLA